MKHIKEMILGWSKKQKIGALIGAIAVVSAAGATIAYVQLHKPEPVVDVVGDKAVETPKEDVAVQTLELSTDSLEKDLNIYITDDNQEKIAGQGFAVKVVRIGEMNDENQAFLNTYAVALQEMLDSYRDTEEDVAEDISAVENDTDDTNDTNEESSEQLTLESDTYQQMLEDYQQWLDGADGNIYTDEDADGLIYLTDMDAGYYAIWYVPIDGYFPQQALIGAEVKDKVEYKPVENIEKKVVAYNAAEDVTPHANVTVEKVVQNTSDFVESRTEVIPAEYVAAKVAQPGGVSGGSSTVTAADGTALCTIANSQVMLYPQPTSLKSATVSTSFHTAYGVSLEGTTVSSSNAGVATASMDGAGNIMVTAVAPGTATISCQVTYDDGVQGADIATENLQTATGDVITVTVGNTDSVLTDAEGHQLYLDNQGQTVATVASYDANQTYYYCSKEADYKYYGWQTIDGERYYFDANGHYVTGEQTISGVMYTFSSDGKLVQSLGAGVDVSKWQGTINWNQVKASGINFAIIRCGGRYSSGRTLYKDPNFVQNIQGAIAAGIKVGVYVYSTALSDAEAVEEASLAVSMCRGYSISLPIFIDMEDSVQNSLTTEQRTSIATAFCETVRNSGYTAGVYANYNWWTTKLNASALSKYRVWIARYNSTLGYSGKYDIWQYSSSGSVPGINGNVDVNIAYY